MYTSMRSLTYPSVEFDRVSERKFGATIDIPSDGVIFHEVHLKHTITRNKSPQPNGVKSEARGTRSLSTQTQASIENLVDGLSQELANYNHPRYVFSPYFRPLHDNWSRKIYFRSKKPFYSRHQSCNSVFALRKQY